MRIATLLVLSVFVPALAQSQIPDTLFASDGEASDYFGYSVDVDGDLAVVGAYNTDGATGAAYVFRYDGSQWIEEDILTAPDGAPGDWFGFDVTVGGDNIVVGAAYKDDRLGRAYAFRYLGGRWTTYQTIHPPVITWPSTFGWSVDIHGDLLVVGAPGHADNGASSGAAMVYRFTGPIWSYEGTLLASDGDLSDFLGSAVAAGPDFVAVGAYGQSLNQRTGAVYLYGLDGSNWVEIDKLTASDGEPYDDFGIDVDVDEDSTVIVGARNATGAQDNSGAAYLFEFGGGSWSEVNKLYAADGQANDGFGTQVILEGAVAAASSTSAQTSNPSRKGAVYVYRNESQAWVPKDVLPGPDPTKNQQFGLTMAMDGDNVIVGAMNAYNRDAVASGAAFLYDLGLQTVDVEEPAVVTGYELLQNYPNPFNPRTTIDFSVPTSTRVRLSVHDLLGRTVSILVDGHVPAGTHSAVFESGDLPSGLYMYRLEVATVSLSRPLVLLK